MAATLQIPDDLMKRAEESAAAAGESVEQFTAEAVQREILRRFWTRNKTEATLRRGNMTDDQVDAVVDRAVQEDRAAQRGR